MLLARHDEDGARLLVLPTKLMPGLAPDQVSTPAFDARLLREALTRHYDTDAYACGYLILDHPDEHGQRDVAQGQSRVNKPGLPWLRGLRTPLGTPDVWMFTWFLDLDRPGHSPRSDDPAELARQLEEERAVIEQAVGYGLPRPFARYPTRGGWRLVYVLAEPMPVDEAEPHIRGLIYLANRAGLDGSVLLVDDVAKDWTRLFRLPCVVREGAPTWSEPYMECGVEFCEEAPALNLREFEFHAGPRCSRAGSVPDERARGTSAEQAAEMLAALTDHDRWRVRRYAEETLEGVARDLAETEKGARNNLLFKKACRCFEFVKIGMLDEDKVEAKLRAAADECGLERERRESAIGSARRTVEGKGKGPDVEWILDRLGIVAAGGGREVRGEGLPPFPLDTLPDVVRRFVESVSLSVQIAPDLPALFALVVIAAAMSRRVRVKVGNTHREPMALWAVVAQEPGERKSATVKLVSEPLQHREAELLRDFDFTLRSHNRRQEVLDREIEALKKRAAEEGGKPAGEANREAILKTIDRKEKERVDPPASPGLIMQDTTPEALKKRMREQAGRALLLSDEGGMFARLADEKGKVQDIDVFLHGHSADPITEDRIGRGRTVIPEPVLNLAVCMQPHVMAELLANKRFRGTGLQARMLFGFPRSLVGQRFYKNQPVDPQTQADYASVVRALYDVGVGVIEFRIVGEALAAWTPFHDRVEQECRVGGRLYAIRDWAAKLAGNVARIAAVLHAVDKRGTSDVDITARSIEQAVAIADYSIEHALHAFARAQALAPTRDDRGVQVHQFLEEKTAEDKDAKVKAEDLRECYQEWCASHGVQPLSGTEFGKVLAACGVESRKSNGRMVYVGVKLVNAVGEEGAA